MRKRPRAPHWECVYYDKEIVSRVRNYSSMTGIKRLGPEYSGSNAWASAAALRNAVGPMKSPEMVRIDCHRHGNSLTRPLQIVGKGLE